MQFGIPQIDIDILGHWFLQGRSYRDICTVPAKTHCKTGLPLLFLITDRITDRLYQRTSSHFNLTFYYNMFAAILIQPGRINGTKPYFRMQLFFFFFLYWMHCILLHAIWVWRGNYSFRAAIYFIHVKSTRSYWRLHIMTVLTNCLVLPHAIPFKLCQRNQKERESLKRNQY